MTTDASSPPSLFTVPILASANLGVGADSTTSPPWFGWIDLETIWLLLLELTPLLRSLELAGYQSSAVELGIATVQGSSSGPPAGWIRVFLTPMEVILSATSLIQAEGLTDPWAERDRVAVRLRTSPRMSAANQELALSVSLGALPDYARQGHLCFASQIAVSDFASLSRALASMGIATYIEALLDALARRWRTAGEAADLNPFEFTQPPGLLWMLDPTFWEGEPPSWDTADAAWLRRVGTHIRDLVSKDPLAFLRSQVAQHQTLADCRNATLLGLLKQIPSYAWDAALTNLEFFRILHDRNEELGHPWSEELFTTIAGFRYDQYLNTTPYLELLMQLAQARLFPFPALPDPEEPSPYDFEEDPIEVHLIEDPHTAEAIGVAISVFDRAPLRVIRAAHLKYPIAECFCWEYREPTAKGQARLIIVAAPGVRIEGREQLPATCQLTVYRVQDYQLVPAWGERIQEALYLAPKDREALYWRHVQRYEDFSYAEELEADSDHPAEPPPNEETAGEPPVPAFRVRPVATGVRLTYPAVEADADASFVLDLIVDQYSPSDRFTYDIQRVIGSGRGEERLGAYQKYRVYVWATPNVKLGVNYQFDSTGRIAYFIWRVSSLDRIPPPGVPLPAVEQAPGWARPLVDGDPHFSLTLGSYWELTGLFKLTADVLIGLSPIGDAVDFAELISSFFTGTDKWGDPVTNVDRALMLGCVLLPFVSSGVVRALARQVR